ADGLSPTQCGGDVRQDLLECPGVELGTELRRDGQQHRVGRLNRLVTLELFDQLVRRAGVGATEDRLTDVADVADLILAATIATEELPVLLIDEREDAAAHAHAWLSLMAGCSPRLAIRLDLLALLHVERL